MSTVNKNQKPTFLIDASIFIFRYYFSLPDHWFSEKDSWPTAAVYGYTNFLIRLLKTEQPNRIAACFDESLEQCFRNEIYPDYKSSRALPDEALAFQLNACREITELLGITCFSSKRYEADDLLGSLYKQCQRSSSPIAILTRDKDLGQLLRRPQDFLWDYDVKSKTNNNSNDNKVSKNRKTSGKRLHSIDIQQKFGVRPEQLVDYLALVGDSIDDIPGVPGIGAKTASELLTHFDSINQMFGELYRLPSLPIRGTKRIADNLQEYREQIIIAQQLATILTELPLISSVAELQRKSINFTKVEKFCHQMGFPKLVVTAFTIP